MSSQSIAMQFYLEDAPGTEFGEDKTAVANRLADNGATLVYFNTEADSERAQSGALGSIDGILQDLYATESPIEGSSEYLNSTERDATYEELFHLLQGGGIQPELAEYQTQIEQATSKALEGDIWTPETEVLEEWRAEGSESFEYIISVIDVFYGLWEHAPPPSFHGEYQVAARGSLDSQDPEGLAAVRAFLPDYVGHWVELDESLEGTFSLQLDSEQPYTLKSQHLRDVGLVGTANSGILGNSLDNTMRGNAGDNAIDGGEGSDTVVYCHAREMYSVEQDGGVTTVEGPDGKDTLRNIESLHFTDMIVETN